MAAVDLVVAVDRLAVVAVLVALWATAVGQLDAAVDPVVLWAIVADLQECVLADLEVAEEDVVVQLDVVVLWDVEDQWDAGVELADVDAADLEDAWAAAVHLMRFLHHIQRVQLLQEQA